MKTLGIRQLKTNPGQLSQILEKDEYLLITRHGEPLGVAIPFSSRLMEQGLERWLALKAFESGDLTLGQLAKALKKSKAETLNTLGQLGISTADYDLAEDLETIEMLLKS
ncbi:MAG: type II toxin-antitoxin system Phd/YefM family antitoxin [Gammaproteobacteria bacterium]|nr:type II toxin-antitoxin system Phd/YefM family antitoxin [Gammaproteobacteria bacterium]